MEECGAWTLASLLLTLEALVTLAAGGWELQRFRGHFGR